MASKKLTIFRLRQKTRKIEIWSPGQIFGKIRAKNPDRGSRRDRPARRGRQQPRTTRFWGQKRGFFPVLAGPKTPKKPDFGPFLGVLGGLPGGAKKPPKSGKIGKSGKLQITTKNRPGICTFPGGPPGTHFGAPGEPRSGAPRPAHRVPPRPGGPGAAEPSRHS